MERWEWQQHWRHAVACTQNIARGMGDGRLLTDGDSGLDASSKRFIGEQQSQVKHMEHNNLQ